MHLRNQHNVVRLCRTKTDSSKLKQAQATRKHPPKKHHEKKYVKTL